MTRAVGEILGAGDDSVAVGADPVVAEDTILETPCAAVHTVAAAVDDHVAHPAALVTVRVQIIPSLGWIGALEKNGCGRRTVGSHTIGKSDVVHIGERRHIDGNARIDSKQRGDGERRPIIVVWDAELRPVTAYAGKFRNMDRVVNVTSDRYGTAGIKAGDGQMDWELVALQAHV